MATAQASSAPGTMPLFSKSHPPLLPQQIISSPLSPKKLVGLNSKNFTHLKRLVRRLRKEKCFSFLSLPLCPCSSWLSSNWWRFEVHIHHWFFPCSWWSESWLGGQGSGKVLTQIKTKLTWHLCKNNKIWKLKIESEMQCRNRSNVFVRCL